MAEPQETLSGFYEIAKLENGQFLAASTAEPFFCFFCDSEEEALARARGAVEVYIEYRAENPPTARAKQHDFSLTTFRGIKIPLAALTAA